MRGIQLPQKVALRHHISAGTGTQGYDRGYAIKALVAKDDAIRIGINVSLTVVSVAATLVNVWITVFGKLSN